MEEKDKERESGEKRRRWKPLAWKDRKNKKNETYEEEKFKKEEENNTRDEEGYTEEKEGYNKEGKIERETKEGEGEGGGKGLGLTLKKFLKYCV